MKVIEPKAEIIRPALTEESINAIYRNIELAGRTCYKSEDKITSESAKKFVKALVKRGHEAMLEHASMTVRFTVDRGVSHEIVRHRIASFAQESTRYCRYSDEKFGNELTFIKPFFWDEHSKEYKTWQATMFTCEAAYMHLINQGATPEQARSVLPNSLKTEIVVTATMREWRHIFKLRAIGTTGKPHPQMEEVMMPLFKQCKELMPELFGDIGENNE
jgi:thymidylate synthase (FAD)